MPIIQRFLENNVDNRRVDKSALRFFYAQMWMEERINRDIWIHGQNMSMCQSMLLVKE